MITATPSQPAGAIASLDTIRAEFPALERRHGAHRSPSSTAPAAPRCPAASSRP